MERQLLQRFGQRVRALRQQHGLSQERFAELCTVHYSVIRHFESGRRDVRFTTVARIAAAFGMSMGDLLKGLEERDEAGLPAPVLATADWSKLRPEISAMERILRRLKELEAGAPEPELPKKRGRSTSSRI